eukprot:3371285-Prymnesium_polylepis.1
MTLALRVAVSRRRGRTRRAASAPRASSHRRRRIGESRERRQPMQRRWSEQLQRESVASPRGWRRVADGRCCRQRRYR